MNNSSNLNFEEEYIEGRVEAPLAILKIKKNGFQYLSSIDKNNFIFEWYNAINNLKEIRTILILNDEDCFSSKNYHDYLSSISGNDFKNTDISEIAPKLNSRERAIEMNMFSNYARKLLRVKKLLIFCGAGEIVTPFFGLSLIADLRFVSDKMYYSLEHQKYGIHPSGLLPFFLPKFVGQGRAMKILLSKETISAEKAFELGLVEKILSHNNFEEQCIAEARQISSIPQNVVCTTKNLVYNFSKELEDYILKEEDYINC